MGLHQPTVVEWSETSTSPCGPPPAGRREARSITDPLQAGTVLPVSANGDPLIWEVSTSDQHSSFEAFQVRHPGQRLDGHRQRITYTSSTLGAELSYDRIDHTAHEVNGVPVDWTEFDHGFQTPWSLNPYGSYQACVSKNGYAVTYDWDPDDDGDFDEMPTKTVDNGGPATPEPTTTAEPDPASLGQCDDAGVVIAHVGRPHSSPLRFVISQHGVENGEIQS